MSSDSEPHIDIDVAIRQLLDQQADVQARLAALLDAHHRRHHQRQHDGTRPSSHLRAHSRSHLGHGLDLPMELDMLRHKHRVLEDMVDYHGLASRVQPFPSDMEEARVIQYRCEYLETVCLQEHLDVIETLRLSSQSAPPEFPSWFDKHLEHHDPVLRVRRERGNDNSLVSSYPLPSLKCWDQQCLHYVYGFSTSIHHDTHVRMHASSSSSSSPSRRESDLSVPRQAESYSRASDSFRTPLPSKNLPRPGTVCVPSQLPPLRIPGQSIDARDSLSDYAYSTNRSAAVRSYGGSEVEPLLPPLKRSRIGNQPRLESIVELQLFQDQTPCLRCTILREECDGKQPCSSCSGVSPTGSDWHWASIGCFRGPITSFVDYILPGFPPSPRQIRTPVTSPLARRQSINENIQRTCLFSKHVTSAVKACLDFQDGFWWSGDVSRRSAGVDDAGFLGRIMHIDQPPPILCALAVSSNCHDASYSLLDILRSTNSLSPSRDAEEASFPILHYTKMLLREVAFYSISQSRPVLQIDLHVGFRPLADADDPGETLRAIRTCTTWILHSFEAMTLRKTPLGPKEWLAGFHALCIFSVVQTLLMDMAPLMSPTRSSHSGQDRTRDHPRHAIQAMFKALVAIFSSAAPAFLDRIPGDLSPDTRSAFSTTAQIVHMETWPARNVRSSKEFLLSLGAEYHDSFDFHGFIKPRQPQLSAARDVPPMKPLSGSGRDIQHSHSPVVPPPGLSSHSGTPSSRSEAMDDADLSRPRLTPSGHLGQLDQGQARRHTVAETPLNSMSSSPTIGPYGSAVRLRPAAYQKPPLRRVFCRKCKEYPDGFRGEHELRRHVDAKHSSLVKRWVCCEPDSQSPVSIKPTIPLSSCKACVMQKHYGAYYNAAAHLRRAHFNPHRGGKSSGDWPPMAMLKDWMREVRQSAAEAAAEDGYREMSSGGEEEAEEEEEEAQEAEEGEDVKLPGHPTVEAHRPGGPAARTRTLAPANGGSLLMSPVAVKSPQPWEPAVSSMTAQMPPLGPLPNPMPPVGVPLGVPFTAPAPAPTPAPTPHRHHPPPPLPPHLPPPLPPSLHSQPAVSSLIPQATMVEIQGQIPTLMPNRSRCPHPDCGRVFKDLASHMLTHQEERPEKCPIETCEYHTKGFARKYDKNRHALTHYRGTMICPFCPGAGTPYSKAFNRADVFKRHLAATHQIEQTPLHSRAGSGGGRLITLSTATAGPGAMCSICEGRFGAPQDFYEHLDDCVLSVLVPAAAATRARETSSDNMNDEEKKMGGAEGNAQGLIYIRKSKKPGRTD